MRVEFYFLLLLLATGLALWTGSRGEKWIGATVLVGNFLTVVVELTIAKTFGSVSLLYLAVDASLAFVLCAIAVRYPSWVAMLVSAFQINGALGHLVKLVAPNTIPFSYAFLLKFWAWPMLAVILLSRFIPQLHAILRGQNWPPFIRPSPAVSLHRNP